MDGSTYTRGEKRKKEEKKGTWQDPLPPAHLFEKAHESHESHKSLSPSPPSSLHSPKKRIPRIAVNKVLAINPIL